MGGYIGSGIEYRVGHIFNTSEGSEAKLGTLFFFSHVLSHVPPHVPPHVLASAMTWSAAVPAQSVRIFDIQD